MKKIGFVGAYDKTDIIIQIAKILAAMKQKVIVIDSSINQKAKYIVPVINPTKTYITSFEDFDVAVGFENFEEIKHYMGLNDEANLEYDIALIDIDASKVFENFKMQEAEVNYFATSFDLFSLKKGLEILSGLTEKIKLTKILFAKTIDEQENEYLDFLSLGQKIVWDEQRIYFLFDLEDQSAIINNQKVAKISLRNLSQTYKNNLTTIAQQIINDVGINEIKRVIKKLEKGE